MFNFAYRNLILFLKDKTAVVLSFLAEFIMVGLYILFLRDNLIASFAQIKNTQFLMDVWMIAGILGVTSVTTTMGAYGIMVDDKAKKIDRDFWTSPIQKRSVLGGYMLAAVVIGIFLSVFIFLISQIYILHEYRVKLGADTMALIYGILILNTISNSSMVLFLVSFLKSSNALASCCTILGALIGFLTGIYLPIGNLPEEVQWVVKCFPVSHGVALLRQALMEPFMIESFGGIKTERALQFTEYMGIQYTNDGSFMPKKSNVVILVVTTIICFIATILKSNKGMHEAE